MDTPTRGSCLCGAIAWETTGPLEFMSHCHCSRCRKTHGAAFATFIMCQADMFRLTRGGDEMVRYESTPGFFRPFCGRCGSVVPDGTAWQGIIGIPAGPLDDDPGVRPAAHIFTASKAPWFDIQDATPAYDAYPPGFDFPAFPDLTPPAATGDATHGSCLCGGTAFEVTATLFRAWSCHCSRCRKARGAAFASNMFVAFDDVRFTKGEDRLASYKVPEASHYTQTFCRTCGSPMPRKDGERGFAIIPMGSLDDDPGVRLERHIFVGSKAPWYDIPPDGLPQAEEFPQQL